MPTASTSRAASTRRQNAVTSGTGYALLTVAGTSVSTASTCSAAPPRWSAPSSTASRPPAASRSRTISPAFPPSRSRPARPGPLRQRRARDARRRRGQRIAAGETLVAIDYRPLTGELYGLAVNAAADTARSTLRSEAAPRPRSARPAELRSSPAAARSTCRRAATAWTSIRPSTTSASPPNPGSISASIPPARR